MTVNKYIEQYSLIMSKKFLEKTNRKGYCFVLHLLRKTINFPLTNVQEKYFSEVSLRVLDF